MHLGEGWGCTLRVYPESGDPSQCHQGPSRDLLAEKLASVWTGGVEGRKGPWPTKKDLRERSDRSGERCCAGMFSQLPTPLWILRFKGLLFFLALQRKQNEETRMDLSVPSTQSIQMALTWQQRRTIKHEDNFY